MRPLDPQSGVIVTTRPPNRHELEPRVTHADLASEDMNPSQAKHEQSAQTGHIRRSRPKPERDESTSGTPTRTRRKHTDPRAALGRLGESCAARHLEALGFRVLARNVRTRAGEIDLIVFDGKVLAFVEVKTRCDRARHEQGRPPKATGHSPLEWLRPRQCARLRRLAHAWLSDPSTVCHGAETIRFDAIGVVIDPNGRLLALDHLEAAW